MPNNNDDNAMQTKILHGSHFVNKRKWSKNFSKKILRDIYTPHHFNKDDSTKWTITTVSSVTSNNVFDYQPLKAWPKVLKNLKEMFSWIHFMPHSWHTRNVALQLELSVSRWVIFSPSADSGSWEQYSNVKNA